MTSVSPQSSIVDLHGFLGPSPVGRTALLPLVDLWEWQTRGACRDLDGAMFFHPEKERGPRKREREMRAKQVCQGCPVIEECRRWAVAVREPYGVWGGLSVSDRQELIDDDAVRARRERRGPDPARSRRG